MLLCCELNFFITTKLKLQGKATVCQLNISQEQDRAHIAPGMTACCTRSLQSSSTFPDPIMSNIYLPRQMPSLLTCVWEAVGSSSKASAEGALIPSSVYFLGYLDTSIFNSLSQPPLMPFFLLLGVTCIQTGANFLIVWDASYPSRINNSNRKIMMEVKMTICKIFLQNIQNCLPVSQASFAKFHGVFTQGLRSPNSGYV